MTTIDPHKLHFGPYRTPRFRYGQRGELVIKALSAARIPWPLASKQGQRSPVLYRDLARAVRKESSAAVAYWWGVAGQTVTKWRRALGVKFTEGDRLLRVAIGKSDAMRPNLAAMHAKARDPVRRAKIAAAKRGKPRPTHVIEALRQANLGRKVSKATRRKMSEAHKRRWTRQPAASRAWSPWEEDLLRSMEPAAVAVKTGRTLTAVFVRRHRLGLPDGRTRAVRRKSAGSLGARD